MSAPAVWDRQVELARATRAIVEKNYYLAEAILQSVGARRGCATTWRLLAFTQLKRGDLDAALSNAHRSTRSDADDALSWNTLGMIFDARGDVHQASAAFCKACKLCPESIKLWANWGKTLVDHGHFRDAVNVLAETLSLGEHGASRKRLAHALTAIGRLDAAEHQYREHLARHPADGDAWFGLASLGNTYFRSGDNEALRELRKNSKTSEDDRIGIEFALSRYAEHLGDYGFAYELLVSANAAERRRLQWNARSHSAFVTDVLRAFRNRPLAPSSSRGSGIIFIVGLPRTGSSLIEQSVARHPKAAAAGEVAILPALIQAESHRRGKAFPAWAAEATDADWSRLGLAYVRAIQRFRGQASVVTDKRTGNWIYVGAIARMLPAARIIYTHRAAVDTCFGCFRQRFSEGAQPFSYDVAECVAYMRDCEAAMRHWLDLHPDTIRKQSHETFVDENAREQAAIFEFCGLPRARQASGFSTATIATASAAQLRTPRKRAHSWSVLYGEQLNVFRLVAAQANH